MRRKLNIVPVKSMLLMCAGKATREGESPRRRQEHGRFTYSLGLYDMPEAIKRACCCNMPTRVEPRKVITFRPCEDLK